MALSFQHGRDTRVYVGKRSMHTILQSVSQDVEVDAPDTTVFAVNDRQYMAGGIRQGSISADGIYDGGSTETQKLVEDALGSTSLVTVSWSPNLTTIGNRARLASAIPVGFSVKSMTDDATKTTVALTPSSRVDYGVWLMNETARTSTASQTSVDNAAASTAGGVAHLHVIAQSTLTSFVAKVQHSSNGSAWSDLITFTAATQETVQRSTVSGTVKRYARTTISTFTGGAGKSVTSVVAFARRR